MKMKKIVNFDISTDSCVKILNLFSSFFVTKKLPYVVSRDVCPSSVEISLERGSKRSAEPIDLKIGLNMDN